jgi:hypothetical protein
MTKIQEATAALKAARLRHAAEIAVLQAAVAAAKQGRKDAIEAKRAKAAADEAKREQARADKAREHDAAAAARAAKAAMLEELAQQANAFKEALAAELRRDPQGQSDAAKAAGKKFNEAKAAYKAARAN